MQRITLDVECFSFISGLFARIADGAVGADGELLADTTPLLGVFAEVCCEQDVRSCFKGALPANSPNRLLELQQHYHRFLQAESGEKVHPLINLPDSLGALAAPRRPVDGDTAVSLVDTAIGVAEYNIGLGMDRLAALRMLIGLRHTGQWPSASAAQAAELLYRVLIEALYKHRHDHMRFVLVQGNPTRINELRRAVFERSFDG